MSIICEDCAGDGLHHFDEEVFELSTDEPCETCGGSGVNESAGKPVTQACVFKNTNTEVDMPIYMGELLDDFEELPIRFHATYVPAEIGSRDGPGGPPLEPSFPAGWELECFYMSVWGEWYEIDPEHEHSGPYKTLEDAINEYQGDN